MIKKILPTFFFTLFCALILALSVRGVPGNPSSFIFNANYWKEDGPFELSPERGRFALLYSIVEHNSFYFSPAVARFTSPDVGYHNDRFVSLFAPGVSFLIMPSYIVGRFFGASQVATFSTISAFALVNALLIFYISRNIGINHPASILAGFVFLFATPSFAYAVSLYQHHISTFLILASILLLLKSKNILSLALVWILIASSLIVDYPNLFLLAPIAIWAMGRIISFKIAKSNIHVHFFPLKLIAMTGVILPLFFFFWFNQNSYGNPLQLSGTVSGPPASFLETGNTLIDKLQLHEEESEEKVALEFFATRSMLNGFYIHALSPDRGVVYYAPVILWSFLGINLFVKKHKTLLQILTSIAAICAVLYSMWGDPWGGWAFGSRYLIPAYAVLAILLAKVLQKYAKNKIFIVLFFLTLIYSLGVNTLGAITTNQNPPQIQVLELEGLSGHEEKYTWGRNLDFLLSGKSKSFIFNAFASKFLSSVEYYGIILVTLSIFASFSLFMLFKKTK